MGGSLSETDTLSMASFEDDFVELQANSVRMERSKRAVIKEELEEAKSVYEQAFEALKAAASALSSKKEEYLQLLEDERKELDAEIASVKAFEEVTWPGKPAAQDASEIELKDEGEGHATTNTPKTGGAETEQEETEANEGVEAEEEEFDFFDMTYASDDAGEEDGEDGSQTSPKSEAEGEEEVDTEETEEKAAEEDKEESKEEENEEGMLVYVLWKGHNERDACKLPADNTFFNNKHEKVGKNRDARTLAIKTMADDTIASIKHKLRLLTGIDVHQQKLFSLGRRLKDKNTLATYRIDNCSTLHLKS